MKVILAGAAAFFAVVAFGEPTSAQAPVELKFGSGAPPQASFNRTLLKEWAEKIEADSGGTMKIKFFYSGALGRDGQLVDAVKSGVADIVLDIPGYYPGRYPLVEVAVLPGTIEDPVSSSMAMWSLHEQGLFDKEMKDLKVLALTTGPRGTLFTTNKEIKSVDDVKGLKLIGGGSTRGKVISALGAAPLVMPLTQTYQAFSRGVADGTISFFTTLPPFKLYEVLKYAVDGDSLSGPIIFVVMNKEKFDSLPEKARAAIDKHSGAALSKAFGEFWSREDKLGRDSMIKAGGKIRVPDAAEQARWNAAVAPVIDEWIASEPGGKAVYEAYKKAVKAAKAQLN